MVVFWGIRNVRLQGGSLCWHMLEGIGKHMSYSLNSFKGGVI